MRPAIAIAILCLPVISLGEEPARGTTESAPPALPAATQPDVDHSTSATDTGQDASVDASAAPGTAKIEEVIVTATKRRTPLRQVPESVTVLSGEQLQESGAVEMQDYLRRVPGVNLTELQPELQRISIRGIDADVGGVTTQTSGVFIDDAPFNDAMFNQVRPDLSPFDLDAVEILKGPQGTLFGGSGLAGAVRYRLADAEPGVFEVKTFGQYQDVRHGDPNRIAGAAVNLPLEGDRAALRLVGVRRLTGGTIDDLNSGETDTDSGDSYNARALLRWNVTDDFSLQIKALKQRTELDDRPYAENTNGRLEREVTLGKSPLSNEFALYGLELRYRMSWASLISSTSVLRKEGYTENAGGERLFGVQGRAITLPVSAEVDGVVQELRLVSPDIPGADWQWLGGIFMHDYDGTTGQQIIFGETDTDPAMKMADITGDVSARELAAFGEISRRFAQRWKLTLGLRAYRIETDGDVTAFGPFFAPDNAVVSLSEGDIEKRGVNPKLALQYQVTGDITSYLSASRGFRFGGIQLIGPTEDTPDVPSTYEPDSVWSYELGFRSRWLRNTLQADGAVFYIDWNDPQVQTTTGGDIPINIIGNVGGARSYGAEFALQWLTPITGLVTELSAAYTNAKTTQAFASPNGSDVPKGARLPGYADFQVAGLIEYRWVWGANALSAMLSHTVIGEGVSDIQQSKPILDYQSTDLRFAIGRDSVPGRPQLSLGVTNLTDERAVVSAFVTTEDNFYAVYNRPRSVDLRLELRY